MTYRVWQSPTDRLVVRLVRAQQRSQLVHHLLCLRGTDISPKATLGPGLHLKHGGIGVVMHAQTRLGSGVTVYQGVTIGRGDIWRETSPFGGWDIGDDVILCAGAVLIASGPEPLSVGAGTVVGANAVLSQSTGPGEVWAGVPARRVGMRS